MSGEVIVDEDGYNVVPEDEPEYTGPGEEPQVEKPSKDEIKVAKWMKKNVKTKKTKFLSHNVEYFTSSKAIDALMKSKFVEGASPLFTTREQAVEFLDIMLEHKFFHRAKKVPVSVEELRQTAKVTGGTTSKKEEKREGEKTVEKSTKKEDKKDSAEAETGEQSGNNGAGSDENGGASATGEKKEKKKRKIRLDMHSDQVFVDGSEAYVWIYDPIPIHYWIYGLVLLLGAIVICMFPLWPPMLRKGVYYLSMAAAGFLVFILVLTVIRLIIFTIVWALTGGNLHFWIFPNLTEDVGFFASFWPLYESKYVKGEDDDKSKKKGSKSKSKKNKDKDSDNEDNDDVSPDAEPLEPEKIEEIKEHDADVLLRHRKVGGKADTEDDSHSGSSSANEAAQESESAKCSQNQSESESDGKDYEIISSSEVQNVN